MNASIADKLITLPIDSFACIAAIDALHYITLQLLALLL